MEIKKPEYIVTIAEERSVTRAAARLYLTRPALSHYLLALESELGAPLFRRTRSGLEPTELGEAYIRGAQRVLDAVRQTQKELDDINGCVSGTLRIGITLGSGAMMFNSIFPKFHERYPGFDIRLLEGNSRELEQSLLRGSIDFAVMGRATELDDLEYISFCKTEIFLLLPRGHRLSHLAAPPGQPRTSLDLHELRDDAFILLHPDTVVGGISERCFRRYGFVPRRILECSLNNMAYNMVKAGLGPAFVIGSQIAARDDLPCFSLDPREYWWISVAHRHGTRFSLAERYFQQLVREYYDSNLPFSYGL